MTREVRARCATSKRLVVKVGTRALVRADGRPDDARFSALVSQIAALHRAGRDVVLVSSGAIGAGIEALGLPGRPRMLPELQMAAAVGQSELMQRYARLFRRRGIHVGQVLLTHEDLHDRRRHLNARNTLQTLVRHRIVPVINENDAIAVEEITFGDNDQLAALVSMLVDAELMVMLSTTNGLRAPTKSGRTRRLPYLSEVSEEQLALAWGKGSALSSGGMLSKLQAAQRAVSVGIPVVIADGRRDDTLARICAGDDVGTLIGGGAAAALPSRKRWLAFFQRTRGALVIDAGAAAALCERGRSLLAAGIVSLRGRFEAGELVAIEDERGTALAQGLVDYSSQQLEQIKGRRSSEIAAVLGRQDYAEVIHRDNLVLLPRLPRARATGGRDG